MSERTAMFLVVLGLLLTAAGVGGIENSITDGELLGSVLASLTGLLIMYCGTLAMKVNDNTNYYE
jgi:hypothetical protein